MDFISEYFYVIILIVGALAQWLKSRSEAKVEGVDVSEELKNLGGEAERRGSMPAVPPPLPPGGGALPGVGRSAVPDLRRKSSPALPEIFDVTAELARQQTLLDQARKFEQTKRARTMKQPKLAGETSIPAAPARRIRSRLYDSNELRSAFVLKEILEKPIGLR